MLRFLSFLILKDSTTDAKGVTGAVIAGGGREADMTLPSRTGRNPAAVLKEEDISAGSEDLHSWKAEGAAEGKKKKNMRCGTGLLSGAQGVQGVVGR